MTELDVRVRVATVDRVLRVFGVRVWQKALAGLELTSPRPFERVPLRWELAFGGFDDRDPQRVVEDPRNPVGRGIARLARTLLDQPGPQIEDPRALIRSHRSQVPPAGVAPIAPSWEPRRRYAGTMDERWRLERMPLPPSDFDLRHYQVAPPEMIVAGYLRGGEAVEITHMTSEGVWRFSLPRQAFYVGGHYDSGVREVHPVLDTVALRPNDRQLDLTWRAALAWPTAPRQRLRAVQVHEKEMR